MEDELRPGTILYCGANPIDKASNHIDLGRECQAIRDAIHGSKLRLYPEYATDHALLLQLLTDEQPSVVHFGLHGLRAGENPGDGARRDFSAEHAEEAGLVLIERDGTPTVLNASKLKKLLRASKVRPRCVVMSACHSEHAARAIAEDIDHVIAMRAAISDASAIVFSRALYRNLARALTFREALEQAAVLLPAPEDEYPVLFQKPGLADDRLLPVAPTKPQLAFRWSWAVFVAMVIALLMLCLLATGHGPLVSEVRLWSMSERAEVAPLQESNELRVALIDAQSEAELKGERVGEDEVGSYGTTWRALHARALEALSAAGARVVVFDVAFQDEPRTRLETRGTAALAEAVVHAAQRGTHVVLTAVARDAQGPKLASSLRGALRTVDPRCAVAHPCIGRPAGGPAVPLLPLVLEGTPPSFALSLCAYALAQGTLPSWSLEAGQVFLASDRASTVAFTGLEQAPDSDECGMVDGTASAVQRLIGPFARDLSRSDPRVLPFERVVGAGSLDDVAGKIVLVGQRDVASDRVFDDADPAGTPLWGVSAHAAAIDALFMKDGLMAVVSPRDQLLWMSGEALLVIFVCLRLVGRARWLALGALMLAQLAVSFVAARQGLLSDPGNHLWAMLIAYVFASKVRGALRITFP